MKTALKLATVALLLGSAAGAFIPTGASAAQHCWYEGTTWDRCNGQICPGGWCCYICTG
jgi:hypothetical protein